MQAGRSRGAVAWKEIACSGGGASPGGGKKLYNYADKPASNTLIYNIYVRLATQNQLTHSPQALLLLPATVATPNPTASGVLGRSLTTNGVWWGRLMRDAHQA